ncbi:MAG: DinB family protein [Ignavibacteria bacterium]
MKILKEQYKLVQESRAVLLNYCSDIKPEDLGKEIADFNNSTVISMLLHIANTYLFWLKRFAGKEEFEYFDVKNIKDIEGVRKAFEAADKVVNSFLGSYPYHSTKIKGEIFWLKTDMTFRVLELFTHVSTHEFHHKGQIMSMTRMLGYTPVDADVIRFN